jgi:hypothetical protein
LARGGGNQIEGSIFVGAKPYADFDRKLTQLLSKQK